MMIIVRGLIFGVIVITSVLLLSSFMIPINDAFAATTFVDAFDISSQEAAPHGLTFNTDGTKMFVAGSVGDDVNEYACSTGFDVSTCSFTDAFDVSGQDTAPTDVAFNTDGTKMFVTGGAARNINEYACSTGFDVSTCSFTDAFSVRNQELSPTGLAFNTDGTKMFVVGTAGQDVNEYACTAFDVSTCSFTDAFSVSAQSPYPQGLTFNSDGTKMFVTDNVGDDVNEYACSTGFDVSTCSFTDAFSVRNQEESSTGLAFNTDGTKMFVIGSSGDDVNEYTLEVGFDFDASGLGTTTFVDAFDISSQEASPHGLTFNSDGTKMFVTGNDGDDVNEYACSTAFDVSTCSFTDAFSVSAQEIYPADVAFNTDGTKMFVLGDSGQDVNEYACTTGFDVSTCSFTDRFSVSSQESAPRGLAFNTDGTKMFVTGLNGDDVNEYACSTGFDVSTCSFTDAFSVSAQSPYPAGLTFNTDGTKMFVVDTANVHEYACTAFDVSTCSFTDAILISAQSVYATGLAFNTDGTKMFVTGTAGEDVDEYTLEVGFDFDSVSAAAPSKVGTVTPTSGNTQVALSWSAPATGGSAITDYIIQYSTDNSSWSTFSDGTSTGTTATVTGLTNGTLYYFKVAAVNGVGTGTYSNSITSTPATTPSKVGTVTPTSGNTQVALSWVAPATGGSAITDYIIQYSTDNSSWTTFSDGTSTGTTATVTGLTNNQQYYFKVAAVNGVGTGTYSNSITSTPAISAPSQVIISTTTESGSTASLSWVAPATGGSAITDYIIQYSTDGSSWTTFSDGTSTDTSVTITGLSECNDYYYRVSAVNGIGTGTTSSNSQNTLDVSAGYDYEGRGVQDFTTKKQFGSSVKFESAQTFGAVQEFGASQIFGEGNAFANSQNFCGVHNFVADAIEFGTTTTFDTAQTFGDAAKFAANQDFTNVNHDFTATAIFFDSGGVFSASEVMGVGADFSSGTQNFGNAMTFGEATEFGDLQDWSTQTYTFEKYMHFGDTNDFAEKIQTFKEGTSFGEGTIFKDNQLIPINTIPSFGMLLQAITCGSDTSSETCMPNDATKYLSPGEFLTVGQDPASTSISISKNNKNFSVDGIGLEMTFAEIETNGTIESDLYDPANIPSSTLVGSTGKVSVSTSNVGTVETIGSVMNISTGTSSISGAITISLKYSDDNIPAGTAETDLTMLHYTGGVWKTEDSCTVDTVNNKVTCTVTSLSPFGIGGPGSGASSSSSSSGGGGGSNCDSNGFGTGRSLMVYNVNYSIDTNLVTLQAYSTCGAIFAKITTESGSQVMGLLMEQPLIDENIVMYSATLHEGVEDFTINLHNKKNTFDEKYYPHGNDITKSYTGETGYTSAQQGMALPTITSEQTTILPETTIVSEPAVEITPEIIEEINDIKTEKPIIDEKSITPVDQTIAHTSELTSLTCGPGTFEKNGICVMDNDLIKTPQESVSGGLENDFVILIIVLPAVVILAIIILAKRRKKSDS